MPNLNPTTTDRTCRVCGCSEKRACLDGCAWVPHEKDLCDSCYWTARAVRQWIERAPTPNTAALIRETATVNPAVDDTMDVLTSGIHLTLSPEDIAEIRALEQQPGMILKLDDPRLLRKGGN